MSLFKSARGALGLCGVVLAAASITAVSVATERVGRSASTSTGMKPNVYTALEGEDGAASVDAPVQTHAERLALFQRRIADFRLLEPRYWSFPPSDHTRRRRASPALRASRLSAAELHAAMGTTENDCLAQAVYYEARGEPAAGQAAVAQVVVNRGRSGLYPKTVCGVVFQGAERAGCQFSFACDGSLRRGVTDAAAWARARTVADTALGGAATTTMATALNYHADYVRPSWAQRLARVAEIGRHIFYGVRDGVLPPGASAPVMPGEAASAPASARGA